VRALEYHDLSKHHFLRFARSRGYLDWANQPDPFRRYVGAPLVQLPRVPPGSEAAYAALYDGSVTPSPVDDLSIGTFLRCSMGLSAWKQYGASRWALRVNPSSGNLHPTESYVIWGRRVCHYAPLEHALEVRCELAGASSGADGAFLVGLTSIHWREAWKYGERAFRYCQHDTGHALGALRLAAAMLGWRMVLLPRWSHGELGALLGVDREDDFGDAEREEPECLALVTAGGVAPGDPLEPGRLVQAARGAVWHGVANHLSPSVVDWPVIEAVADATRSPAVASVQDRVVAPAQGNSGVQAPSPRAATIILQRRSALAFNPQGALRREAFLGMLARLRPGAPPWDLIDWPPQVHLALFVHRVVDITPGIYLFPRDPAATDALRMAMRSEFLWEAVAEGLYLLAPLDVQETARQLSCNQDIAGDGFFSLGMIARTEPALRERGEWFYRRLFWECGLIGQVLYLEAEAAGARATGIGCFFDDPVHDLFGLEGHGWQSLYHFSMGVPLDDGRLTTAPGYAWELPQESASGPDGAGPSRPQS
jgi:SagB-type dehydrogenase family enzyme